MRGWRAGLLAMMMAAWVPAARACPNCKDAVADQPEQDAGIMAGYNWSVLFMVAVPMAMVGGGTVAVTRAARRGMLPEL